MEMPMNPSSAGASDLPSSNTTKPAKKVEDDEGSVDDSETEKPSRRSGRRKIKIEYIEDKNRRHITFSKRKAGIMKKAYELSTLTGTQVLLLVVSETGLVYTFTTVKLQPIVTKPEGKNLIQACLNAPDPVTGGTSSSPVPEDAYGNASPGMEEKTKTVYEDKKPEPSGFPPAQAQHHHQPPPNGSPAQAGYQPYVQGSWNNNHPNYMAAAAAAAAAAPYQPQQPPASQPPSQHYGGPMPSYYGNPPQHHHQQQQQQQQQQPPYLSQHHPGYWPGSSAPPPSRSHHSMARHDHPGSPAGEHKEESKPGAAH